MNYELYQRVIREIKLRLYAKSSADIYQFFSINPATVLK